MRSGIPRRRPRVLLSPPSLHTQHHTRSPSPLQTPTPAGELHFHRHPPRRQPHGHPRWAQLQQDGAQPGSARSRQVCAEPQPRGSGRQPRAQPSRAAVPLPSPLGSAADRPFSPGSGTPKRNRALSAMFSARAGHTARFVRAPSARQRRSRAVELPSTPERPRTPLASQRSAARGADWTPRERAGARPARCCTASDTGTGTDTGTTPRGEQRPRHRSEALRQRYSRSRRPPHRPSTFARGSRRVGVRSPHPPPRMGRWTRPDPTHLLLRQPVHRLHRCGRHGAAGRASRGTRSARGFGGGSPPRPRSAVVVVLLVLLLLLLLQLLLLLRRLRAAVRPSAGKRGRGRRRDRPRRREAGAGLGLTAAAPTPPAPRRGAPAAAHGGGERTAQPQWRRRSSGAEKPRVGPARAALPPAAEEARAPHKARAAAPAPPTRRRGHRRRDTAPPCGDGGERGGGRRPPRGGPSAAPGALGRGPSGRCAAVRRPRRRAWPVGSDAEGRSFWGMNGRAGVPPGSRRFPSAGSVAAVAAVGPCARPSSTFALCRFCNPPRDRRMLLTHLPVRDFSLAFFSLLRRVFLEESERSGYLELPYVLAEARHASAPNYFLIGFLFLPRLSPGPIQPGPARCCSHPYHPPAISWQGAALSSRG